MVPVGGRFTMVIRAYVRLCGRGSGMPERTGAGSEQPTKRSRNARLRTMPGCYRFSMPSSRDHSDPWFRIGAIDVTTTVFISVLCVISFFVYAADKTILAHLYLEPYF